ncbi:MAG: PAS domain S-box protein [Sphingobacteriales bacterium]|nr:MAG: PAS domain S-box protein [Sphingobacteriales bacterium]
MSDLPLPHRIEQLFEFAPDAVVVANEQQQVTEWNRKAVTTFGYTKEETMGRLLNELIIPQQYREAHQRGMAHFLATGEGPVLNKGIEITALHKDGHEFPISLNISNIRLESEWMFVAFMADITERKAQEEKMKAQHAALKEIAKIQSHEIRGPVASIMGIVGIMKEHGYQLTPTELLLMETACYELDDRIRKIVDQTYL